MSFLRKLITVDISAVKQYIVWNKQLVLKFYGGQITAEQIKTSWWPWKRYFNNKKTINKKKQK